MMPRLMVMMALALPVAGCATGDDPVLFTNSVPPVAPTLSADVATNYAAAYLPQVAGGVESVRQSSEADRVFQTILYPNPGYDDGENRLTVSIAPTSAGPSYYQAPTRRQIDSEMRRALPDAKMRITSTAGRNLHGPFGYAIGPAANGGTCIFAWQTAADIGRAGETGIARLTRTHYAAKIRLRYCHPSMAEASLVSLMAGLRIREVSQTSVEMLRFAEGSGVAGRPGYAAEKPAPRQNRPVTAPVKTAAKSSNAPKKQDPQHVAPPVRNAPRILKPGELAGYAGAQAALPVLAAAVLDKSPAKTKSPAIPLPAALNH